MTSALRRGLQVAIPAAVAVIWLADLADSDWRQAVSQLLPFLVTGSGFAIVGLIAWSLRPRNRIGSLMIVIGFSLLFESVPLVIGTFAGIVSFVVGLVLGSLWPVVLLHLLLAFPSGRLDSPASRAVVISLYVFVPVFNLSLSTNSIPWLELLNVEPQPGPLLLSQGYVSEFVYLPCFGAGVVLTLRRWLIGGAARRRSIEPLMWSIGAIVIASILPFVAALLPGIPPKAIAYLSTPALVASVISLPIAILVGLLRSGLDMTSVGSLVVKLSTGLSPERLQPALAQALNDPSLEVLYWVPDLKSFANQEGQRVELPGNESERAASVLDGEGEPVAALVYDSSLLHETELVGTAAAAVRMALENARLQVQLKAQLEEVRRSRARLVEAGQQERRRVERDLHDGAQQHLVTLLLSLQMTKSEAVRHSDTETAALIETNIAALKQALSQLRELARGIYPSILTEAGLVAAIRSLAERSPIPVDVTGDGEGRLDPELEATLYFVAAEAITNAIKHSGGRHVVVSLHRGAANIELDISDDGHGGASLPPEGGLRGLADRLAAVGGRLQVDSGVSGTTIHCEAPCAS